jgi:CheY-like chemotaxis protein
MKDQERGSQGRILVVDQEEWCRSFLSSVIKLLGFEDCTLVNTVAEALAALEENPFDLVITDQRQPEYQRLLDNARLRHPGIRFIVMLQHPARHPSETAATGRRRNQADETGSLADVFGVGHEEEAGVSYLGRRTPGTLGYSWMRS